MAKAKRGLPADFALDLPEEGPVRLGDYLDEFGSARLTPPQRAETSQRVQVRAKRIEVELPSRKIAAAERHESPTVQSPTPMRAPSADIVPDGKSAGKKRPDYPRMEINLNPQAQRMVQEIIKNVQEYSVQHNAKASEIFQAMVEMLHHVLGRIDYTRVPRRGKWGTPTADAFRVALGEAFARAIADGYREDSV